jgi:hypothetical protein
VARRKPKERVETSTPKAEAKRLIASKGLTVASHEAINRALIGGADNDEFAAIVQNALDAKIQRTEARKLEAKEVATA